MVYFRPPQGSELWLKIVIIMNIAPDVLTSNISPWHGTRIKMVKEKILPIEDPSPITWTVTLKMSHMERKI